MRLAGSSEVFVVSPKNKSMMLKLEVIHAVATPQEITQNKTCELGGLLLDTYGSHNRTMERKKPATAEAESITAKCALRFLNMAPRLQTIEMTEKVATKVKIAPKPYT